MLEQVEERDLFLRRIDERWFRLHLIVEFLRQRLESDQPDRVGKLHRTASRWFAEHRMVGEDVDRALAAGDEQRAVALVETDGIYLLEHSQMATVIFLVDKLPAATVQTHPRLQLALAWADITVAPLQAVRTGSGPRRLDSGRRRSERAGDRGSADRGRRGAQRRRPPSGPHRHHRPTRRTCLDRATQLRPFVVSAAANIAVLAAAYRGDLDEVHRLQDWAAPDCQHNTGNHTTIHGVRFTGLAAWMQLDLVEAEACYRKTLKIAKQAGGGHSYTTRLASSLLGELLYERGNLDEAERLLDAGYRVGPEGGGRLQDRPLRDRGPDQGAARRSARRDPTARRGRPDRQRPGPAAAAGTGGERADPASGFRRTPNSGRCRW